MVEFESFLQYYKDHRQSSPDTLRAYRSDLKFFGHFLSEEGITRLSQVDHSVISRYMEKMKAAPSGRTREVGLSDATIARRLAAVSSFLDFMRVSKYPKLRNPIVDFPRRWKRNNRPKPVDEAILDKILTTISEPRDRALIELFLASGLRLSEIAQLNRKSIVIERTVADKSVLGVGEVIGKGGKSRTFYVHENALRTVFQYEQARKDQDDALFISERMQRMSKRAMQERLAYWCAKAGVPHVRLHRLRHTFATRLVNAEMDILQLKELMGHNSLATTLQYTKIDQKAVARGYHAAMEYVHPVEQ